MGEGERGEGILLLENGCKVYLYIYIYICVYECGVSEQKIRFVAIDRAALIAFILPRDNEKRGQLAYFVDATGSSLL